MTPTYLDCCDHPDIQRLRALYSSDHDMESLDRCVSCATFWFYRFHEYHDVMTSWYSPLTADEGEQLLGIATRDEADLSFLTTRASWMDDEDGITRVPGTPDHPWS